MGYFTWFLFPSLHRKQKVCLRFLLWAPSSTPGDKCHDIVSIFLWLGSPGVLKSQTCLHYNTRNWSSTVQILLYTAVFSCESYSSSRKQKVPVFTCLSKLGGSGLPYILPSVMDPGRVLIFSLRFLLARAQWNWKHILLCYYEYQLLTLYNQNIL